MFNLKKFVMPTLCGMLAVGLSGCDPVEEVEDLFDDSSSSSSSSCTDSSYYRFVNLSAQGTVIEVEVDDEEFASLDAFESSDLTSVDTGTYDLVFNQILPNSENDSFIDDDTLTASCNTIHSYILYGDADSPESIEVETDVETLFDDDFEDDYDYGLVQVINVADSNESYDVYLVDAGDDLLNQTADDSLSYLDESEEIEQDEGDYKLLITESGTDTIVISSDNISIESGEAYLYAIVSYEVATSDSNRFALIELDEDSARTLTNDSQPAYVRFNHGVAGNSLVDIYVDDGDDTTALVTSLSFGEISEEISLTIDDTDNGDSREFYILDSDTLDTLDSFTIDVDPSSQLDILMAGIDETSIRTNDAEEDLRTINTHAKIIFSHSIDDEREDSLEFKLVENGGNPDSYTSQVTLSYLTSEEYEVEQGDYEIYVYNEDTDELLLQENLYSLSAGDVVNLTATEDEDGGTPYALQEVFN